MRECAALVRRSHEFLYRSRPDSAMRRPPSTGNLATVAAHLRSAAESGAPAPSPPRNATRRDTMKWETPSACDFRFGFEITMYIATR